MTATDASTDRPDLSFVFAVHRALTEDAAALVAAALDLQPEDRAGRIGELRRFFAGYSDQLVSHHTHEDEVFFPALLARVGADAMAYDELEAQHHALDQVIQGVRSALEAVGDGRTDFVAGKARAVEATSDLVRHLAEHLELEERVAIPLYRETMTVAEHLQLEERVQAMGSLEQLRFMVPWLFDRLPPAARVGALAGAPDVFGVVYGEQVDAYRFLVDTLRVRPPASAR